MSNILSNPRGYTGWGFTEKQRDLLLKLIPSSLPDVVAHHITENGAARSDTPLPSATEARIVGTAQNDRVQALVIEIGGSVRRADGEIYHCTWSLDRSAGAKPIDSKALVAAGYDRLPIGQIPIEITPQFFLEQPGAGAKTIDFAKIAKQIAARKELADTLGQEGQPIKFQHGDGRKALAGPDMSKPGLFRLTLFDKQGPVGHTEFVSLRDAAYEALAAGFRIRKERPDAMTDDIARAGAEQIKID